MRRVLMNGKLVSGGWGCVERTGRREEVIADGFRSFGCREEEMAEDVLVSSHLTGRVRPSAPRSTR
jgi:hypothetical protein